MSEGFPIRLLEVSDDTRLAYFAEVSIKHSKLIEATKQLWRALNSRVKDSIIFVYGPAGVGKTTLCEHVISKIIKKTNQSGIKPDEKKFR
ncbi:MAG: NB-ARC domain-containing protein [Pyrinomonadaceae bacterium]